LRFLPGLIATVGRSERQARGAAHQFALLVGEFPFEAIRVDDLLALIGGHRTQVIDCFVDQPAPIWGQLLHFFENLTSLLLLLGSQMLPGLHAIQHPKLLLRRQAGETLQAIAKYLLTARGKVAKGRVILQGLLLLVRRQVFVLTQPVAGVPLLARRLNCGGGHVLLRCRG